MKTCPKCRISVRGTHIRCPLCQNELLGEADTPTYPPITTLVRNMLVYRIQLFAAILALLLCPVLDFQIGLHGNVHWSIIADAGVLLAEFTVWQLIRKYRMIVHDWVFRISLSAMLLLVVMAYNMHFLSFCAAYIFPSFLILMTTYLFILALADKTGNVLPYLLVTIAMSIVIAGAALLLYHGFVLLWTNSLLVSAAAFIGILIFKGSKVLNEIQKRFHM